ncbi:MAG: hypothetical protein U1C04_03145 [Hydrogenophaga sp.]|uniref:hypothetical protein n=1 Tax=Hydrogenophaga sp. TaxID=1904254 RepID=UPI002AB80C3C|nr:hypothetical protein [Hydrogenophaga sp.]MDZ4279752.1 hypothetical protein [Hydrogenophaga sp.]
MEMILETRRGIFRTGGERLEEAAEFAAEEGLKMAAGGALGKVLSRISITERGLTHVKDRHTIGGTRTIGKSVFSEGEDIAGLVRAAEKVQAAPQAGGNLQRVVDAGRIIGTDRATGQPTTLYTVITDSSGDLVTAFPGVP